MEDFAGRDAALEYWFLKVVSGDLAFLVDWIVRREVGEAEVRVSLWVRGRGRVLRDTAHTWRVRETTVEIADATFTPTLIDGAVDDVRWDLRVVPGTARLDPVPPAAKRLHPFDLELVSRPRARFSGVVEVAGERFTLLDARGTLTHYWGRRLPASWVWISADGLDGGDTILEAVLMRTRLWRVPRASVYGGYVVVDGGGRTTQVVAPAYGRITGSGDETSFALRARAPRRQVRLTASADRESYNDLGEDIRQTLLADVAVEGWGGVRGRCGLEFRGPT
ncbi:MAG TPA: hypothetical protein VMI11_12440 [Actinomycetes bacterium]|nr:hypothetical protein [Actinomycetes bacterium]